MKKLYNSHTNARQRRKTMRNPFRHVDPVYCRECGTPLIPVVLISSYDEQTGMANEHIVLAWSQGFDLAAAIVSKFNRTSEKIGAPHRLLASPAPAVAATPKESSDAKPKRTRVNYAVGGGGCSDF